MPQHKSMVGQLLDLVIFHPLQLLGSRPVQAAAQQGQHGVLQLRLGKCSRSPLAFASVQEGGLFSSRYISAAFYISSRLTFLLQGAVKVTDRAVQMPLLSLQHYSVLCHLIFSYL